MLIALDPEVFGRVLMLAVASMAQIVIEVDIAIKPGNGPNSINCNNEKAVIPVAILSHAGGSHHGDLRLRS